MSEFTLNMDEYDQKIYINISPQIVMIYRFSVFMIHYQVNFDQIKCSTQVDTDHEGKIAREKSSA